MRLWINLLSGREPKSATAC